MSRQLTDLKRVELSIPPALFRVFVMGGISATDPSVEPLLRWLGSSLIEPIIDLPTKQAVKIMRRVNRAVDAVCIEYNQHDSVKVLLMAVLWLKDLLDRERIVLIEGSDFALAADMLIDKLGNDADRWAAVERSAVKQSAKLRQRLEGLGYFK